MNRKKQNLSFRSALVFSITILAIGVVVLSLGLTSHDAPNLVRVGVAASFISLACSMLCMLDKKEARTLRRLLDGFAICSTVSILLLLAFGTSSTKFPKWTLLPGFVGLSSLMLFAVVRGPVAFYKALRVWRLSRNLYVCKSNVNPERSEDRSHFAETDGRENVDRSD